MIRYIYFKLQSPNLCLSGKRRDWEEGGEEVQVEQRWLGKVESESVKSGERGRDSGLDMHSSVPKYLLSMLSNFVIFFNLIDSEKITENIAVVFFSLF